MENISLLDANKPEKIKAALDEINKTLEELEYQELDPTVPDHVKTISQGDIDNWNEGAGAQEYVDEKLKDYAKVEYVNERFNGASKPESYDTYSIMITALNAMNGTEIRKGQDIHIVQTGIPDVWVAYIEDTSVPYTYVDDDTFVNELLINGTVQVGYYKLGYLETQKFDPQNYIKNTDYVIDKGQPGIVTTDGATYGVRSSSNGLLFIDGATKPQILAKSSTFKPLTASEVDYIVQVGMTTNTLEWTDEQKASARELLGVESGGNSVNGGVKILTEDLTDSTTFVTRLKEICDSGKFCRLRIKGKEANGKISIKYFNIDSEFGTSTGYKQFDTNTEFLLTNIQFSKDTAGVVKAYSNYDEYKFTFTETSKRIEYKGIFHNSGSSRIEILQSTSTYYMSSTNASIIVEYLEDETEIKKGEIEITSTGAVTQQIEPNILYNFTDTAITSLTITFADEITNKVNEYMFQFIAGNGFTTLTMPTGVIWLGGKAPTITSGKTYMVSVVNNLAVIGEF